MKKNKQIILGIAIWIVVLVLLALFGVDHSPFCSQQTPTWRTPFSFLFVIMAIGTFPVLCHASIAWEQNIKDEKEALEKDPIGKILNEQKYK